MEFGAFFSQVYLAEVSRNEETTTEKRFATALSNSFIYFNDFVKLFQNSCGNIKSSRCFGEKIEISEVCQWDEMFDSHLSESLDNGAFKMSDYNMLSEILDLHLPETSRKLNNVKPMVFRDFSQEDKIEALEKILDWLPSNKQPSEHN